MAMTDPIASMLTRIRNASRAKHPRVDIPYSTIKEKIVKVLADERYITDFKIITQDEHKFLRVYLGYTDTGESLIGGIDRISRPGLRKYVGATEMPRVLGGLGMAILTTPKGVMSSKKAKNNNVGGEVLCTIW